MTTTRRVLYEPFIDDPEHITQLEGQRFVVLRPTGGVNDCHRQAQDVLRQRFNGWRISYPARAHVTLAGFAAGTTLESVQDLVSGWIVAVPPLQIEIRRAASFPPPFQIAILEVVKTPALFGALQSLRRSAEQRGLTLSTVVPAEEWIFHMSLAYCSKLTAAEWKDLTRLVDETRIPNASCVQETVEIAAFDDGSEYSGGIHTLPRQASNSE